MTDFGGCAGPTGANSDIVEITVTSASVGDRAGVTVSLKHDNDDTPVADANMAVSELSENVGDQRQDCAVVESRPRTSHSYA